MTDEPEKPKKQITDAQREALEKHRAPAWKEGESGNSAGKPKGIKNRSTILKKYLEATFKNDKGETKPQPFHLEDGTPLTVEEAINLALIKKAMGGDVNAIAQVLDTAYGKLTDKRQQLGKDDQPVDPEIRVRIIDAGHRDD